MVFSKVVIDDVLFHVVSIVEDILRKGDQSALGFSLR